MHTEATVEWNAESHVNILQKCTVWKYLMLYIIWGSVIVNSKNTFKFVNDAVEWNEQFMWTWRVYLMGDIHNLKGKTEQLAEINNL